MLPSSKGRFMTIAKLTARRYHLSELWPEIAKILEHIVAESGPRAVYLIGSAVRDEFTEYSDLDFVIVVDDAQSVRASRGRIHRNRPCREVPVDFMVIDQARFDERADVGGIAFEAKHHGKSLYQRGSE
jgi:predicted nucleotidyltransferase